MPHPQHHPPASPRNLADARPRLADAEDAAASMEAEELDAFDSGRIFAAAGDSDLFDTPPRASASASAGTSATTGASTPTVGGRSTPSSTSDRDLWTPTAVDPCAPSKSRGSLAYGASIPQKLGIPGINGASSGPVGSAAGLGGSCGDLTNCSPLEPEERMVKSTARAHIGRRGTIEVDFDDEMGMDKLVEAALGSEILETESLNFDRTIELWKEGQAKKPRGVKKLIAKSKAKAEGRALPGTKHMWEIFMDLQGMTEDNPGRRHARQAYSKGSFVDKVDRLFKHLDVTKTGLLEFLEFSYFLDGLRGRTHCFLRNAKGALAEHADLPVPDQEFELSNTFKTELKRAIQSGLFSWRQMNHAWALDLKKFRNLVELVICAAIQLVMNELAAQGASQPGSRFDLRWVRRGPSARPSGAGWG